MKYAAWCTKLTYDFKYYNMIFSELMLEIRCEIYGKENHIENSYEDKIYFILCLFSNSSHLCVDED